MKDKTMKKKVNGIVKVDICLFKDNQNHRSCTGVAVLNTPSVNVGGNSPYQNTKHSSLQKEFENFISYSRGQYIIEINGYTHRLEGKKTARAIIPILLL